MIHTFAHALAFELSVRPQLIPITACLLLSSCPSFLHSADSIECRAGVQWKAHTNGVLTVNCSSRGNLMASGGGDNLVKLWDARSGKLIHTFQAHQRPVASIAFSPDDKFLASKDMAGRILIWDVKNKKQLSSIETNSLYTYQFAFTPDNKCLVCGRVVEAEPTKAISVWTTLEGKYLSSFGSSRSTPICMTFTNSSSEIIVGNDDGVIHLWDSETQKVRRTFLGHKGDVFSLALLSKGKIFASAGEDGVIWLWDITSGKEQRKLHCKDQRVVSISASKTLPVLAAVGFRYKEESIDTGELSLWSLDSGIRLARLRPTVGMLYSVHFDSSGKRFFVACDDGVIRSWELSLSKKGPG